MLEAEKKYNAINENIREIQVKLTGLKENKARNEATIEGIENRKKDLLFSVKNELNIDNESSILPLSDLSDVEVGKFPSIEAQTEKIDKTKKERESLGSVNLRADEETKKYELEIKNFEVEVGPLKYIAAVIYGDDAKSMLDETVRYVILLLIFVFDPLAVLLLIAANQSYRKEKPVEKEKPLSVNVGKTVRTATVDKGVKKVTKERDGVKIHFYEVVYHDMV